MNSPRKRVFAIIFITCAFAAYAGLSLKTGIGQVKARDSVGRTVPRPRKHVVIDKTHQMLRAYEGSKLVFKSHVSTGRGRSTPNGRFYVQGKEQMHYSRRYDNAPMPYSVHLRGHYFIHGFGFVPNYPASHGCIRLPLNYGNPAKKFYEWVEIGTLVIIVGEWRR